MGDTTSRSSPTQVGSLTNWGTGGEGGALGSLYFATRAVKTDGTVWAWGQGNANNGLNNTTQYSSPVQVGSLTTWFYTGSSYFRAIKTAS